MIYLLEEGRMHSLFAKAKDKGVWIGRTCFFLKDGEHLPFVINGNKFILEFLIPPHLLDSGLEPKTFHLDINEQFIPRREYRTIQLYKVSETGVMEMNAESEDHLDLKKDSHLFISALRQSLCLYITNNLLVRQFFFWAKGPYAKLMEIVLDKKDEFDEHFILSRIEELKPPIYGFELSNKSYVVNLTK